MAEIFVSYARKDEAQAKKIAEALCAQGHRAWRDDELPPHRAYAEVIEERLNSADAVIVLWSEDAKKSQWVRAEADDARNRGTLIQARLDGTIPPIPFNQIQCADLSQSDNLEKSPGWTKLVGSIQSLSRTGTPVDAKRPRRQQISVCVLPFENMSGDSEQEYFSDGISEDITTDLSKVSALDVVARNTAFQFKGQPVDVCDIAGKLGVSHVLEGSVRKAGDRVRITAQLIDGCTGGHIWADRYDRELDNIFDIQDEISTAIVGALRIKLLPEEKKSIEQRGTTNVEAYKMYLLARCFWVTGNYGDPRREERVMRISGRAVEIDPYYAQAWALMALAQSSLFYDFGQGADDGYAAAHTALSIDGSIAEAYLPMIRRLEERGRTSQADEQMQKALELGANSWEVNKEAGRLRRLRADIKGAAVHYEKAVALMESDFHSWALLLTFHQALGDHEKVLHAARMMVSEAEKALKQDPSNGAALGIVAGGFAALGEPERAREWIDRAILIDPENLTMRYNFACILAAHLNDKEGSLRLLERIFGACGEMQLRLAETDPDFKTLHDDPRFQLILEKASKRLRGGKTSPAIPAAT